MSRRPMLTLSKQALAENYQRLASLLGPADCGATVKANAYGTGIEFAAPVLHDVGCNIFFVAYLREAIELRCLLPEATIYIFHGVDFDQLDLCYQLNLRPVITALFDLQRVVGHPVTTAIHMDSGMHRLGIPQHEFEQVYDLLPHISCAVFMSHLASADDPDSPQNIQQLLKFQRMSDAIGDRIEVRSLANTAGILLCEEYHFDLARPGIGLYGGSPDPCKPQGFSAVVTWYARVLEIQIVKAGECIGYGGSFKAETDIMIATLGTGYADGYLRALSHHSSVVFEGMILPIIGRVSMDLITVDLSQLHDSGITIAQGDLVEVMGSSMSIDTLASNGQTIGYELLSRLGSRFEKSIC